MTWKRDKEACRFRLILLRKLFFLCRSTYSLLLYSSHWGRNNSFFFYSCGRHSGLLTQEPIPGLILSETVTIAQQVCWNSQFVLRERNVEYPSNLHQPRDTVFAVRKTVIAFNFLSCVDVKQLLFLLCPVLVGLQILTGKRTRFQEYGQDSKWVAIAWRSSRSRLYVQRRRLHRTNRFEQPF